MELYSQTQTDVTQDPCFGQKLAKAVAINLSDELS